MSLWAGGHISRCSWTGRASFRIRQEPKVQISISNWKQRGRSRCHRTTGAGFRVVAAYLAAWKKKSHPISASGRWHSISATRRTCVCSGVGELPGCYCAAPQPNEVLFTLFSTAKGWYALARAPVRDEFRLRLPSSALPPEVRTSVSAASKLCGRPRLFSSGSDGSGERRGKLWNSCAKDGTQNRLSNPRIDAAGTEGAGCCGRFASPKAGHRLRTSRRLGNS